MCSFSLSLPSFGTSFLSAQNLRAFENYRLGFIYLVCHNLADPCEYWASAHNTVTTSVNLSALVHFALNGFFSLHFVSDSQSDDSVHIFLEKFLRSSC